MNIENIKDGDEREYKGYSQEPELE